MRSVDPGKNFDSWKIVARGLLAGNVRPEDVIWEAAGSLFGEDPLPKPVAPISVPADLVDLAQAVACHNDPTRWALLYRIFWRIIKGGERKLLEISSDRDVAKARAMQKNVRREIHKMHAFVRFRKVGEDETGRERFVAWFEPDHFIVEAGTPFFRKRFANMDWSIFTPKGCAHWFGEELKFTEGIAKDPTDNSDEIEAVWRTYYRSIFNPARLKVDAMRAEMPKRYWKNLPEADLIVSLVRESQNRVGDMLEIEPRPVRAEPKNVYLGNLKELSIVPNCSGPGIDSSIEEIAKLLPGCRQCPLWKSATRAVPGEGPVDARIMIVGEQPGDREDLEGRPFVGPAGILLNQALAEAGIDRSTAYLTNAVKHFKWEARGKHRLHQKPAAGEIDACKPWLLAELSKVAPEILIILGNTAARSLLGTGIQVSKVRGIFHAPHLAKKVILTVHPSFLLRLPDEKRKKEEYRLFISDLQLAMI